MLLAFLVIQMINTTISNGLFESIVNEHAPIKRKRVRKNDVPYMTKEWKIAIRNKRKYAVRFAKNRTQENFELKKKYRNLATKERRKAIQEYWHKKTEEMHDKPASFFKAFKPFLKESNKQTTHLNLRTDRAVVTDQAKVANLLANYFTSVTSNIGGDHVNSLKENDHQEQASIKAIREAKLGSKFDFKLVNEVQVAKALDKFQPRKACGWNPSAPPSLLKMAASGVAPSLTHLYNDCITTGKWPRQWKMGEWTPAFKKEGVQEKSNYRPITSLIAVDKVFEQLLGEQVTEHFNPILYSRSTAYRKKHSCETTLLSMLEDWKLAIDRRELRK